MQALFVTLILLVALVILVPMLFMVGAFYRTVAGTFRASERPQHRPEDRESVVDSRARPPRRDEVADADASGSNESARGSTPPGSR